MLHSSWSSKAPVGIPHGAGIRVVGAGGKGVSGSSEGREETSPSCAGEHRMELPERTQGWGHSEWVEMRW